MKGWLLDANVVSELHRIRPDARVLAWANGLPARLVTISILTLAEIEQGLEALRPSDPSRREIARIFTLIEATFVGRVRSVDDSVVRRWARIRGQARRHFKKSPPPIDALLAATAIEHDLYLATRNTRDMKLTGARLFDPWRDDPALFPLK